MVNVVTDAVASLGFRIRRQRPFESFNIGSLTAIFYPASDDTVFWESRVNQFLLYPTGQEDSAFFIAVDALIAQEYFDDISSGALPSPFAVAVSNNAQITPPGVFGALDNLANTKNEQAKKGLFGLSILHALLVEYVQGLEGTSHVFICGGGFMKDYPELGPFPFSDQKELAEAANALSLNLQIHGSYPGETYTLDKQVHEGPQAPFVTLNHERFALLKAQSRRFIEAGRSIDMIRITASVTDTESMKRDVDAALQDMTLPLMLSTLGQFMVGLKKYMSGSLGSMRMVVCLLDDQGQTDSRWALDIVQTRFVRLPPDEDKALIMTHYPFGIVAYLSDFHAMIHGRLQIWDIAGVALRTWFMGSSETSPVAFLYSWFGEHIHPKLYEIQYRRKVTELGYTWITQ